MPTHFDRLRAAWILAAIPSLTALVAAAPVAAAPGWTTFNDDGGWNWLQDRRAVMAGGTLVIASVATGVSDPRRAGDVDIVSYDPGSGVKRRTTLHHEETPDGKRAWKDDHDCPALLVRPDGRIVAMYARHGVEAAFYYRITESAGHPEAWGPEKLFVPSATSAVTCANLLFLGRENGGRGRILSFYRGLNGLNMPSWAYSDDLGESWSSGGLLITMPRVPKILPYVKYSGNGTDTVQIAYTTGHQHDFHNSLYHIFYRDGRLFRSDGTPIGTLAAGGLAPEEGTRIFQADLHDIVWISNLETGPDGNPYLVYSVQVNSPDLHDRAEDHRYRYARWTGHDWADFEIAHAGGKLHAGVDDCTGLISVDPRDPDTVFISTNAEPAGGRPLISAADHRRHWEIFEGRTDGGGRNWSWTAVTHDSPCDNIRPIVVSGDASRRAVVWLRGTMTMPDDYSLAVVGFVTDRARPGQPGNFPR